MKPAIFAAGLFVLGPWALGLGPAQVMRPAGPFDTTPTRVCGEDMTSPRELDLTWANVVLAGDSRMFAPCVVGNHTPAHREQRESALLVAAATSPDAALRRAAAQAFGKLGPGAVGVLPEKGAPATTLRNGPLVALLKDQVPDVRAETARAFIRALDGVVGERLLEPAEVRPDPVLVDWTRLYLTQHLATEQDDRVAAAVMETLGVLRYADDRTRDEVEVLLSGLATGPPLRVFGAAKGLEALIRLNPKRKVGERTIDRLRDLAVIGPRMQPVPLRAGEGSAPQPGDPDTYARVRRLAMMALQTARDEDLQTLQTASQDADWQVRRLVALRMDAARPEFASMAGALARDTAFQVRYEMLLPFSRLAEKTRNCDPLYAALDDASPIVVLRTLDLLPPGCIDRDAIVQKLESHVVNLQTAGATTWHLPARALTALSRLDAGRAKGFLPVAVQHGVWQVRATAAGVAATLGATTSLTQLSTDSNANVRTAVLEAMRRTKAGYAELRDAAFHALGSTDHQLLRTAATIMPPPVDADRDRIATAMIDALSRLTRQATDTSRDARVALVQRLAAVLPAARSQELQRYLEDFDPKVRAAAIDALTKLTGKPVTPSERAQHRYPLQPRDLTALPTTARITLQDGSHIDLELLVNDAPVTVARFAALARNAYYNGLTFHRIAPNFVIQGGSPGANEYAGVARYMRDEIGAHHTRGAVGISTRGRDTGDLQIFVDHVDVPRLDHEYTVFARVTSGMQHVDRMLEGAQMRTVTVK